MEFPIRCNAQKPSKFKNGTRETLCLPTQFRSQWNPKTDVLLNNAVQSKMEHRNRRATQ
jgi:hypothetical protein